MSAVETFRDALFGNPPSPTFKPSREGVLAGFSELYDAATVAQYATAAGVTSVGTTADRDAFYATAENQGKLVYVNNNNGSATDPANGVYEYVNGAARIAQSFYNGLATVVQPYVDDAVEAAASATASAASIAGLTNRQPSAPRGFSFVDSAGKELMGFDGDRIRHAHMARVTSQLDYMSKALQMQGINPAEGAAALSYPQHLSGWRTKMAQASSQRVALTFFSNSIGQGQQSQPSGQPGDDTIWRASGFVAQTRNLFAARYGTLGEGVIVGSDPRVTRNGTLRIPQLGITLSAQGDRINGSGQWVQYALNDVSNLLVHGFMEYDDTPPFAYQIDGGAVQTADASFFNGLVLDPAFGGAFYSYPIGGLARGAHTIRILPNPSTPTAQIDIAGVSQFVSTQANGLIVNRVAIGGGRLSDQFALLSNGQNPRAIAGTLKHTGSDLVAIAMGANESSKDGQALGHTPDTYRALLTDVVTYALNTHGAAGVVLLSLTRWPPNQESTLGQENFYAVHEAIAAANPKVAHLDIARIARWRSLAAAKNAGLMFDTIHPNLAGHTDLARLVFDAVAYQGA